MEPTRASIDTGNAADVLMSLANSRVSRSDAEPTTAPPPIPQQQCISHSNSTEDDFSNDVSTGPASSSYFVQERPQKNWEEEFGLELQPETALSKETVFHILMTGKIVVTVTGIFKGG